MSPTQTLAPKPKRMPPALAALLVAVGVALAGLWVVKGHRYMLEHYGSCVKAQCLGTKPGKGYEYAYMLGRSRYIFTYDGRYAAEVCVHFVPFLPTVKIVTGPVRDGHCDCEQSH